MHLKRPVRLYFARFQDFVEACTENMSASGMYIRGTAIQSIGTTFEFAIALTDDISLIEGTAEVRWIDHGINGKPTGMGVHFVELIGDSSWLVARIVESNLARGKPAFDPEAGLVADR